VSPLRTVACVTACNEERTIGPLLDALLQARPDGVPIEQVVVVSSACTDATDAIVAGHAGRDLRVKLVAEPVRRGKAAAIGTFLSSRLPGTDVTLVSSADVKPAPGAIEAIVEALRDERVGMAGGRPVPQNPGNALVDRMARLLWTLHHEVALRSPKLGELVAFRSALVTAIDERTVCDEASVEAAVKAAGATLRYVPGAVVENLGPATLSEWLSRRRSIAFGHQQLERTGGYRVSTSAPTNIAPALLQTVARAPESWVPGLALVAFEVLARSLAKVDGFRRGKRPWVWEIARNTKRGLPG
jgi:cellulose synthase/poly-beta-1,6-N-acetylglucosamine synthase-like glycosyltransferase